MSSSLPDDVTQSCLLPDRQRPDNHLLYPKEELRQKLMNRLKCELVSCEENDHQYAEASVTGYLHKYCQAVEALGMMSILIREILTKGTTEQAGDTATIAASRFPVQAGDASAIIASRFTVQFHVPTTETIDFHRLMDMPLPFASDTATALPLCHIAVMTSKCFLEEGEWTGVCSQSFHPSRAMRFSPPMRGMRFQTYDDLHQPVRNLQTKGEDSVGSFHLRGKINLNSGEMMLEKQQEGRSHCWHWSCVMTPFGIAGTWGGRRWGGWVWLWKV